MCKIKTNKVGDRTITIFGNYFREIYTVIVEFTYGDDESISMKFDNCTDAMNYYNAEVVNAVDAL